MQGGWQRRKPTRCRALGTQHQQLHERMHLRGGNAGLWRQCPQVVAQLGVIGQVVARCLGGNTAGAAVTDQDDLQGRRFMGVSR